MDKEVLVGIFSDIVARISESGIRYNKKNFDQAIYRNIISIPELTNLSLENFLQNLNPYDNTHYQEIAQSISERIRSLETITVRDLKSVISEQYQRDHTSQEQQYVTKLEDVINE